MKCIYSLFAIGLLVVASFANAAFSEPSTNKINVTFGAGFDDATVVTAVGGNYHTTKGEQRKEVMRRAALIWSQELNLKFDVEITVDFSDSYCSTYSANLGYAGPQNMYQTGGIWYPSALGNQIAMSDTSQDGMVTWKEDDIHIDINALIDTGCFSGAPNGWYYGLDNTPIAGTENLLSVVVHEIAHGLGFLSMTDSNSGSWFYDYPDSYSQHLYDNATDKAWTSMTDAERAASGKNGNLAWNGSNTNTYANSVLTDGTANNRTQMYSPNPIENGSSISHFSTDVTPNQVMEPFASDAFAIDIESRLMKDIGWTLPSDEAQPVITVNDLTINIDKNATIALAPLHADSSSASVGETYMYKYSQLPTNGSLSDVYSDTPTYTPNTDFTGTDVVKFIVYDQNFNLSDEGTISIVVSDPVVDNAPVTVNDSYTFDEDSLQQTLDVLANDSDDNSLDASSITLVSTFDGASLTVSGGNILLTPDANVNGSYSFTYTVDDNAGNTSNVASVAITITAKNDTPVAVADTFTISEDHAGVTLDLLANDIDIDSTLSHDDISIISNPTHGMLSDSGSTFNYVPNSNFFGNDSFTYLVSDGELNSQTVTVTINVTSVNDAPISIQDGFTLNQNTAFDLHILSNDSDVDHSVNYDMVNIVSGVANGSLNLTSSILTYTPDTHFFGTDSFTYYLNDGTNSGNTVVVNLTVAHVNTAPVAVNDSYIIDEDTQTIFDVISNDTDDVSIASISITGEPSHGTLTVNNNNSVTYVPDENYAGTDSFIYKITDDESAQSETATVSITINNVNDAPVANNDSFTIVNGSINIYPLLNDTDEDINSVTIVIDNQPSNGSVSISGQNVVYLADENFVGLDSFTYYLVDSGNINSEIATVDVSISSDIAPQTIDLSFTLEEDSENNTLDLLTNNTFSNSIVEIIIISEPTHGDLTISGTSVTYSPDENYAGNDSFNYQIKDSSNLVSNESSANIIISEINDNPIAINDTATVVINNSKNINVLNNDWDESISTVSIEIVSMPTYGSVSIQDAQIIYVADNQFVATMDQLSYQIVDSQSATSNVATVDINITLEADLPVAYNDEYSVIKNESLTFNPTLDDDFYTSNINLSVLEFDNGSATTDGLNVTITPDEDYVGNLNLTYTIIDDLNQSSNEAAILITVINDDIASIDYSVFALMDTEIQFDALAINSSITEAQITISKLANKGEVSVVDDEILYQPYVSQTGQDEFAYMLTQTDQSQIQVFVAVELLTQDEYDSRTASTNILANDDEFTVIEDSQLTLDVLFNDQLNDSETLQINIVQSSMNGQVSVVNQSITYLPNTNFYGADSFIYEVIDTQTKQKTNTATVDLDVLSVNDAPTSDDFDLEMTSSITLDLFSNASDVDGTLAGVDIVTAPEHGLLILSGNQATYTVLNGYTGLDRFTYTVSDNQGEKSDVIEVAINISALAASDAADNDSTETVKVEVTSSGAFNLIELGILLFVLLSILMIKARKVRKTIVINS